MRSSKYFAVAFILFSISSYPGYSQQSREISLGVDLSSTNLFHTTSCNGSLHANGSYSGNIFISLSYQINTRNFLELGYYLEDYFPSVQVNYSYQSPEFTREVMAYTLSQPSNTFRLIYGHKIPFSLLKNQFIFTPNASALFSFFNTKSIGYQDQTIITSPGSNMVVDTLSIIQLETLEDRSMTPFLGLGFDVETYLIKDLLAVRFRSGLNLPINASTKTMVVYRIESEGEVIDECYTHNLLQWTLSLGVRLRL